MKLTCEIVQDLLPLYVDDICSQESRAAVEEHLEECPECRKQLENIKNFDEPEIVPEEEVENKAIVKGIRKVRRRWAMSLISLLLIIPIVMLSVNQYRGEGICFTNIDEIIIAKKYIQALRDEDYEKAAEYMDYEDLYNEMKMDLALSPEDFDVKFNPITIGEEKWMVTEDVWWMQHVYERVELSELDFWGDIIFNNRPFMIPEDKWNEIRKQNVESFQDNAEGQVVVNGIPYEVMETKWGNYFKIENTFEIDANSTAAECALKMGLVPLELYEAGKAEIRDRANEQYELIKSQYGSVSDMTLDEFTDYVKRRYMKQLKSLSSLGYSFGNMKFEESFHYSELKEWEIVYKVEVTYNGKSHQVSLDTRVKNGKIILSSLKHVSDFPEINKLDEKLTIYYLL